MDTTLPEPIAAYFAAGKVDSETLARCFANDAVVKDEGHTYTGVSAIQQWQADALAKYQYTSEPMRSEQRKGMTVVTCHVTGNFPGSPIDLRYFFRLERGKVASLEIRP